MPLTRHVKIHEAKTNKINCKEKKVIEVEDFDTLSVTDRSYRQKRSKNIVEVNSIMNQLDQIDIYGRPQTTTTDYTFFSNSHRTFIKTNYILNHKTHLNKLKKIEIIQCMFSDHNGIKLETSNRNTSRKSQIIED